MRASTQTETDQPCIPILGKRFPANSARSRSALRMNEMRKSQHRRAATLGSSIAAAAAAAPISPNAGSRVVRGTQIFQSYNSVQLPRCSSSAQTSPRQATRPQFASISPTGSKKEETTPPQQRFTKWRPTKTTPPHIEIIQCTSDGDDDSDDDDMGTSALARPPTPPGGHSKAKQKQGSPTLRKPDDSDDKDQFQKRASSMQNLLATEEARISQAHAVLKRRGSLRPPSSFRRVSFGDIITFQHTLEPATAAEKAVFGESAQNRVSVSKAPLDDPSMVENVHLPMLLSAPYVANNCGPFSRGGPLLRPKKKLKSALKKNSPAWD